MRETVTMWRRPRLIALAALVTVVYASLLVPFKHIEIIPGLTTVRPANFLPVVAGLLFGPAGAWGAAFGNVFGDLFGGTWNAVSGYGAVANFLAAYVSYRLWGSLGLLSTGSRPDLRSAAQLTEYVVIVVGSSAITAAVLGWGMAATGTLPFATFATVVFASNGVVALVFGPPVLYVLYPRVEARGWLAAQILSSRGRDGWTAVTDRRHTLASVGLWALVIAWFVGGTAYSLLATGAPLYSLSTALIGTIEPVAAQRWAGRFGLAAVVALGATRGRETPLERLLSPPDTGPLTTLSARHCLYATSGLVGVLLAVNVFRMDEVGTVLAPAVIPATVSVGSVATVAGGTAWLNRYGYRSEELWRILMWTLGGLAAFTLLFGTWGFYTRLTFGAGGRQSLQTTAVSAQAGMIAGFVLGVYDVRTRQQNQRMSETREQLELLNRVLRHDIRNRMQVVRGRAELLESTDDATTDLLSAADEVIDLTETATDATEIGVHRDTNLDSTSLRTVVRESIWTARARYDADIGIEGSLPKATVAAADTLSPLLDHLLHNAVVHNDTERPRVVVSAEKHADSTTVAVADNGPGVPEAWKTAAAGAKRGDAPRSDAVGLYLARAFVDRCDGSLTIRDGDPTGCVIEIELPRVNH